MNAFEKGAGLHSAQEQNDPYADGHRLLATGPFSSPAQGTGPLVGPSGYHANGGADPFEPGRSIGSYEILRELGRGGMGRVYLARDAAVGNRLVAVKVILVGCLAQEEGSARFMREIESLARLRHTGIVTIFTAGSHQAHPYFVMDYVSGRSLTAYTEECAVLGEQDRISRIVRAVGQVARAVHHAHTKGVAHRDLKPSNILITHEADDAMVLDFGIAKQFGETSRGLTRDVMPGTPAYMAPEQIDVRLSVRPELVDVWALGVLLYRALTGASPFRGNDFMSIARDIVDTVPDLPHALNQAIPREVEDVIVACLDKDPNRRPGSASEVADRLEDFLSGTAVCGRVADADPLLATRVQPRPSTGTLPRRPSIERMGRRAAGMVSLFGAILAFVVLGIYADWKPFGAVAERSTSPAVEPEPAAVDPSPHRPILDDGMAGLLREAPALRRAESPPAPAEDRPGPDAAVANADERSEENDGPADPLEPTSAPVSDATGFTPIEAPLSSSVRDASEWLAPQATAAENGTVVVRSNVTGDEVFIDGRSVGASGPRGHELEPGRYEVVVRRTGHPAQTKHVTVERGESAVARFHFQTAKKKTAKRVGVVLEQNDTFGYVVVRLEPGSSMRVGQGLFLLNGGKVSARMRVARANGGRATAKFIDSPIDVRSGEPVYVLKSR